MRSENVPSIFREKNAKTIVYQGDHQNVLSPPESITWDFAKPCVGNFEMSPIVRTSRIRGMHCLLVSTMPN